MHISIMMSKKSFTQICAITDGWVYLLKCVLLDPLALIIPYKNAYPSYFWHD